MLRPVNKPINNSVIFSNVQNPLKKPIAQTPDEKERKKYKYFQKNKI